MRARADVFAIVTITLLFVTQTLAFNLRGLTDGAQGIAMRVPPFPAATFELPFYYVLVALLAIAMLISFGAMRSKFGLSLAAIRGDEDKARGIGVAPSGSRCSRSRSAWGSPRWWVGSGPTTRRSSTRSSRWTR